MAVRSRSAEVNPAVLLLHAGRWDRDGWAAVLDRIPGFARPLVVDLSALGAVRGTPRGAGVVSRLAAQVARRLAVTGPHRPHVVGHSLGGAVALEVARRMPVAAVTAFCPLGFGRARWAVRTGRTGERDDGDLAATPVNLVWGERDRIVPPGDAQRARRALPHARHTVVLGCGHLIGRDDADAVAALVHAGHSSLLRNGNRSGIEREPRPGPGNRGGDHPDY